MTVNLVFFRSIFSSIFILISLIKLNDLSISQINSMENLQDNLAKLSYKILSVEHKVSHTLAVSQKIQQNQSYMPIFYACGTVLVLITVFFMHSSLIESFAKSLQHIAFLSEKSKKEDIALIQNFKNNFLIDVNQLDTKVNHLLKVPGVSDSVLLHLVNKKFIKYASDGTPKVLWESLKNERLRRIYGLESKYPNVLNNLTPEELSLLFNPISPFNTITRYASDGTPKVLWESLKNERLRRIYALESKYPNVLNNLTVDELVALFGPMI